MQHSKPESGRLTDAQRGLVESNLGLVGHVVNTCLCLDAESIEDMFQVGVLGLMKAAQRFDDSRGVRFATFATHCILNQIRQARRNDRTYRQRVGGSESHHDRSGFSEDAIPGTPSILITQPDAASNFEDMVADADMATRIEQLLDTRPGQSTDMAKAYLIQGMSQKDIAREWAVTQPSVSRNVARALKWLRKQLEDEGNGNDN